MSNEWANKVRPVEETLKCYKIKKTNIGLFFICGVKGGRVPASINGHYTSYKEAMNALKKYASCHADQEYMMDANRQRFRRYFKNKKASEEGTKDVKTEDKDTEL